MSQAELVHSSVAAADAAVALIAERLLSPESCAEISLRPSNRDALWDSVMWEPVGLGHGHPGVALLFSELARTDERWNRAAATHVASAMRAQASLPSNGLYYGPTATYSAVRCSVSRGDTLSSLHRPLAAWVAKDATTRARAWKDHFTSGEVGVGWSAYDIVNGLSGQLRVLLCDHDRGWDEVDHAVESLLDVLTAVASETSVDARTVPGWWVPNASQPVPQDREQYPLGDFNLGMAHGIAGVVAVLAAAVDNGVADPRIKDSLAFATDWLVHRVGRDTHGLYWPARISWEDEVAGVVPGPESTRAAWCYGTPGVAAALLAADPHVESNVADVAVESLYALDARGLEHWGLDGATVCHGYAGLLQILVRATARTQDLRLQQQSRTVAELLLAEIDPSAPFAVRHSIPTGPRNHLGRRGLRGLDVVGTLEGAAGVACALADWSRLESGDLGGPAVPTDTAWDLTLALS